MLAKANDSMEHIKIIFDIQRHWSCEILDGDEMLMQVKSHSRYLDLNDCNLFPSERYIYIYITHVWPNVFCNGVQDETCNLVLLHGELYLQ